jgi:prepilin-type N-terminal cleavage/methylation domain-containing protein
VKRGCALFNGDKALPASLTDQCGRFQAGNSQREPSPLSLAQPMPVSSTHRLQFGPGMRERMHVPAPAETRKGFTISELLVTITLVAVLASAFMSNIMWRVDDAEQNRLGQDARAIRTAVEYFVSDVRRYPATVQQVAVRITTRENALTTTGHSHYTAADVARWRGPYLRKDSIGATRDRAWAFEQTFEIDTLLPSGSASVSGGQRYMVLKRVVPRGDSLSILRLDRRIDDGDLTTGSMRLRKGAADTLKFLILPIS